MVFGSKIEYHIYVDGSKLKDSVGYGVVILKDGEVIQEFYGTVPDELVQETEQIAGEIYAVRKAIEWCKEKRIEEVSIFYDYNGLEKWATGAWKTNLLLTREYAEFVKKSGLKIHWHKVDSHTKNVWNDRADLLAKMGSTSLEKPIPTDLQKETEGFIRFLQNNGYKVNFKGIYNSNFAKIQVFKDEKDLGHINIYLTKKEGLVLRLHELKDKTYEPIFDSLWKDYLYGEKQLLLF
ncbi:MAG: hypothetical protein ACPL7B_00145 [Candidatus Poribacteria bacterium]